MNKLTREKRVQVLAALVEGNSIRSTVRMTGVAKNTVTKLLVDVGAVCAEYQDQALRNLSCKKIQCDEIWSYCYAKQKNIPDELKDQFGVGDVWTWVAIDPETKLVISHLVGLRNAEWANAFMADVASRLTHRVQLTTDGFKPYLEAVDQAFGADIDYAMLVKMYGSSPEAETRYSPAKCIGSRQHRIAGKPKKDQVSTSHVER
ncbi:MAG: IS1 family transposase, partial [Candidatus Zixiibacteriota bacterium]